MFGFSMEGDAPAKKDPLSTSRERKDPLSTSQERKETDHHHDHHHHRSSERHKSSSKTRNSSHERGKSNSRRTKTGSAKPRGTGLAGDHSHHHLAMPGEDPQLVHEASVMFKRWDANGNGTIEPKVAPRN